MRNLLLLICYLLFFNCHANAADERPKVSPETREALLVLSTGRTEYLALHQKALDSLAARAPESLVELMAFLDPEAPRERGVVRDIAKMCGPRCAPRLQELVLQSDTHPTTALLLHALGSTADSASAGFLAGFLSHEDRSVRAMAAYGLGECRDSAFLPPLAKALSDGEPVVRRIAADSLGRFLAEENNSSVAPALREALGDSDPWVRRNARRALEKR